MKRLPFFLLIALLLTALPAYADILFFPDGTVLHRDPLCPKISLTTEYFLAETVVVDSYESLADDVHFKACEHCQYPFPVTVSIDTTRYYNPDGGSRFHYNRDCPSVSEKYLPLVPLSEEITALRPCSFCSPIDRNIPIRQLADIHVWNASLEEKALLLPGIWTLPSPDARLVDEAHIVAHAYLTEHYPGEICVVTAMHYDDGLHPGDGHETYRLLATTALRKPLCIISIDALSGDIYRIQLAADLQ